MSHARKKVFMVTSPSIDPTLQLLPRSFRSAISQVRSGYCSRFQSYRHSWTLLPLTATPPTTRWPITLAELIRILSSLWDLNLLFVYSLFLTYIFLFVFLSISLLTSVFPLFFLFFRPCLIHARMPEIRMAFVHGHTFLHSWSGPLTLVVGLLHGATFLSYLTLVR